jgi:isopenicillin-N epimerase
MIDLDVAALGVSFYTGNCHKWMCAPKGSAFLWSSVGHRDVLRPGTISHGWDGGYPGESRYHQLFDFTGTHDPSAYLTVPTAIRVVEESLAGGWHEMRTRNHELALAAREVLCAALAIEPPAPDGMIGTLAAVPVPPGDDDLGVHLAERHRIEAPVFAWPTPPQRLLRVSAQLHNTIEQYDRLAEIVATG